MARKRVYQVTDVQIGLRKSNPPVAIVEASGLTRTLGWTNAALEPRMYTEAPADGIQDYDFVAAAPNGFALQAIGQITAPPLALDDAPAWVRGVRIHAETNWVERSLAPTSEPLLEAAIEDDPAAVQAFAVAAEVDDGTTHDFVVDEITLQAFAGEICHRVTLLKLSGWPEFKTVMEDKCVNLFGRRHCVKLPAVYRRDCEIMLEAEICWPGGGQFVAAVEDCAKQAVAAGVLVAALTGNFAAASAALEAYLRACLTAKKLEIARSVRVGLRDRRRCGSWRRV